MKRRHLIQAAGALPWLTQLTTTRAQAPALADGGPIKIIVAYPPGGTSDAIARLFAEEMQKQLKVQFVVDNKPGAGGQIAAEQFKLAKDPRTLLLCNNHMLTTLPLTSRSIKYDPVADFVPIGELGSYEVALAVGPALAAGSLQDYLKLARASTAARNFAIPAPGSTPHFIGYVIGKKENIDLAPIPYKGVAPLLADLMGGQVAAGIGAVGALMSAHRAGKVRMLAVTGPQRTALAPEVPTFAELGYSALGTSSWESLFASAAVPATTVAAIAAAIQQVSALPSTKSALANIGFSAGSAGPERLREMVKGDLALWRPIIKETGFQVD